MILLKQILEGFGLVSKVRKGWFREKKQSQECPSRQGPQHGNPRSPRSHTSGLETTGRQCGGLWWQMMRVTEDSSLPGVLLHAMVNYVRQLCFYL